MLVSQKLGNLRAFVHAERSETFMASLAWQFKVHLHEHRLEKLTSEVCVCGVVVVFVCGGVRRVCACGMKNHWAWCVCGAVSLCGVCVLARGGVSVCWCVWPISNAQVKHVQKTSMVVAGLAHRARRQSIHCWM